MISPYFFTFSLALFFMGFPFNGECHRYHDHDEIQSGEISITSSDGTKIAATLIYPAAEGSFQCVILAGGTLSETRDGGFHKAPKRDALKRLSNLLVDAGYATLRFDKRGFGLSDKNDSHVTYQDQAEDLKAAMLYARNQERVLSIIVAGESAGAYLACLAAKDKSFADGYVFLGGLYSPSPDLYAYNFGQLKNWAELNSENMAWAKQNAFHDLRTGYGYEAMFAAAKSGDENYTFSLDGKDWTMNLDRKREELDNPPGDLFKYIPKPTFALQGDQDMNVPVGDNEKIVDTIRQSQMEQFSEADVTAATIPNADHNFQTSAATYDERIKERFRFSSINNSYSDSFYEKMIAWLQDRFPADIQFNEETRAWGGVQVIQDISDPVECPGVETVEGRIGPLMKAEESQAHYIEMMPGQFTPEHAHSSESIIFTVKGNWVLCRAGHRKVMKPGTLYHFARNIPTGYEVPFDDPAYILIFKSHRAPGNGETFLSYLRSLKDNLNKQHDDGSPFFLSELPSDHPARVFARKVNPEWEKTLSE